MRWDIDRQRMCRRCHRRKKMYTAPFHRLASCLRPSNTSQAGRLCYRYGRGTQQLLVRKDKCVGMRCHRIRPGSHQLLPGIVLDVCHRVRERAPMERIAIVADLLPHRVEDGTCPRAVTRLALRDAFTDADHDRVGFGRHLDVIPRPCDARESRVLSGAALPPRPASAPALSHSRHLVELGEVCAGCIEASHRRPGSRTRT
jgi:hypothetical protein